MLLDGDQISQNVATADAVLKEILAALQARASSGESAGASVTPASTSGAAVLGGALITVSLPQIQLDILRQGIASEDAGYGNPSISSLVVTAPAGGKAVFANSVGTNETWVLLAPLEVNSDLHDSLLLISASVDVPTLLLIPSYPFMQDRSFPSTTLRAVRKSLSLVVTNGTSSSAEVNFVVEYAIVPTQYFQQTVLPILRLGQTVYQNVAAAARAKGLVS